MSKVAPFSLVDRKQYPIEVRHTICHGIAFYRSPGQILREHMVMFVDGSKPKVGDRMLCGACMQLARDRELVSVWPGRCVWCGAECQVPARHCKDCVLRGYGKDNAQRAGIVK